MVPQSAILFAGVTPSTPRRLEAALASAIPLVFLAVALIRVWPFADDVPFDGPQGDDWYFYKTLAASIVQGGLTMPGIESYVLVPHGFLYNYFVAAVFAVCGINTAYVYVAQAFLVGAACSLLWMAVRRQVTPSGGLLTLALTGIVVYLDFVRGLAFRLLSESLFVCLLAACLAALKSADDRRSRRRAAGAGALLGLAVLSRTSAVVAALGILAGYSAAALRTRRDRLPLAALLVFGFTVAMSLLPLREYAATGRPNLDLITNAGDWVRPPEGLAAMADYYGRRVLFMLGVPELVYPDYRPRPHWLLIWLGAAGYLRALVRLRRRPDTVEQAVLLFLPLYLGPVLLVAGIENYGGRMVAAAMPFAAVLAARFVGDVTGEPGGRTMGSQRETRPRRFVKLFPFGWFVIAAAAACGSPGPSQHPRASVTASPTPAPLIETPPEPAPSKTDLARWSRPATGDLDAIRARGVVRILVPPGRTAYDIARGLQYGATFSAGKAFARFLPTAPGAWPALRVVFIPTRHDELVGALNAGRGDIAANLILSPDRDSPPAAIVPALTNIRELVVTGPGVPPLVSLEDLEGRRIHVATNSRHHASLAVINARLAQVGKHGCTIVTLDGPLTDEDLLARVDDGRIPATVVDSHILAAWKGVFARIAVNEDVAVSQDAVLAWAVRNDAPQLLEALKAFAASAPAALFPTSPARPTSPTRPVSPGAP